jgi:hypothetical protein
VMEDTTLEELVRAQEGMCVEASEMYYI